MSHYTSLAETEPLDTEYLLPEGMIPIPRGDVTGIFGEGSMGKGRASWSLIAQVVAEGGTVLVVLPEDNANEQVRPRAEAAGIQALDHVINLTRINGKRFKLSADTRHDGDIVTLAEAIAYYTGKGHDVKLVVIDPLAAVVGWGSIASNAGARRVIESLQDVAESTGVAIFLVMHPTKSGKLAGSAGVQQALRLLYTIKKDSVNPLVRIISTEKANNEGSVSEYRFVIEDDGNGPRVIWLTNDEVDRRVQSWRTPPDEGMGTKVRLALEEAVVPLSPQQIALMTDAKLTSVRTTLWRMRQRGQAIQTDNGWTTKDV